MTTKLICWLTLGNGIGETLVQPHKGNHCSDGHPRQLIDSQHRSDNGHQGVADPADIGVHRHQQVGVGVGFVRASSRSFSLTLMEISFGGLLVAEYLYHLLAVQHLLDKTVHGSQIHLLADIVFRGQFGKAGSDPQHPKGGNQRNPLSAPGSAPAW